MRIRVLFVVLLCAGGCAYQEQFVREVIVPAAVETVPVPSDDDAADDPAIWVDPKQPQRSIIIGTDKRSGLLTYTLQGEQMQYMPIGDLNNVDLRSDPWGQEMTIIAATQRNPAKIALFRLNHATRQFSLIGKVDTELLEPYGLCMYLDREARPHVIANSKSGLFIDYLIMPNFDLVARAQWRTETQPEGCVVDDVRQRLYFGEEGTGIWVGDLRNMNAVTLLDSVDQPSLVADVEGMSIYHGDDASFLVVSSQGDNSFAVYDLKDRAYLGSFHVGPGETVDGVNETDGLDVTAVPLPGFPKGLLVVQDGYNQLPREAQNFKLVSWSEVAKALGL